MDNVIRPEGFKKAGYELAGARKSNEETLIDGIRKATFVVAVCLSEGELNIGSKNLPPEGMISLLRDAIEAMGGYTGGGSNGEDDFSGGDTVV